MNELAVTIALVAALGVSGRLWVLLPLPLARGAAWLALVAGVAGRAGLPWEPVPRMVALCCVLLAAMKALVYIEWAATGRRLGWGRFLAFVFLWFGMDPGAFATRRRGIEWRAHLGIGLGCVVAGTIGALVVRAAGWTWLLAMFVPMSVGFHFGALRIFTAGWRRHGFPVRTLFRNPLASRGLADFWAARWNVGYSQMMARVVMRPAEALLGHRFAALAVFIVSGVLHEVAITLPVNSGYGLPTLYFMLQGVAVEIERPSWPAALRRLWAASWVVVPVGLLFPPAFREEVIVPCLHVLPNLSMLGSP